MASILYETQVYFINTKIYLNWDQSEIHVLKSWIAWLIGLDVRDWVKVLKKETLGNKVWLHE